MVGPAAGAPLVPLVRIVALERRDELLGRLPIVPRVAVLMCPDETQGQRLEAVVRKEFPDDVALPQAITNVRPSCRQKR